MEEGSGAWIAATLAGSTVTITGAQCPSASASNTSYQRRTELSTPAR
jgi:hypothetical protein